MKGIQNIHLAVWMTILVIGAPIAAISGTDGERLSSEAIIKLVSEGRNQEAIHAFEELPEDARDSLHLLQTMADCYWHTREFESAKALYNEILKQRPTLQGLVPDDQPVGHVGVPIPVMVKAPVAENEEGNMGEKSGLPVVVLSVVDEQGIPPVAALPVPDSNTVAVAAGVDTILEQLRREYLDINTLAQERENLLQARLRESQADAETAMEALKAQHQAREQALAMQVTGLEQTVEAMRLELETERAAVLAQEAQRTKILTPPGTAGEPVSLRMATAGYYRDQHDYAAACELYKQILEERPDDVDAKRKLIMTLFDMRRYDDALDSLGGGELTKPPQEM